MALPVFTPEFLLILSPVIIPWCWGLWRCYNENRKKLTLGFFIDLLTRSLAIATGIAYALVVFINNLPEKLSFDIYLSLAPLSLLGALHVLNYFWTDLTKFLDSTLKEIKEVKQPISRKKI